MAVSAMGVPFAVDGQAHTLCLTTRAQLRYQRLTGESVLAAARALEARGQAEDLDTERMVRLFQAGLGTDATEDLACDLIDGLGQVEAGRILGEALSLAFGAGDGSAEGNGTAGAKAPKTLKG
jgi:hypothetical protein